MMPGMTSDHCHTLSTIRESPYSLPTVIHSPAAIPEYMAALRSNTTVPTSATMSVNMAVMPAYSMYSLLIFIFLFLLFFLYGCLFFGLAFLLWLRLRNQGMALRISLVAVRAFKCDALVYLQLCAHLSNGCSLLGYLLVEFNNLLL